MLSIEIPTKQSHLHFADSRFCVRLLRRRFVFVLCTPLSTSGSQPRLLHLHCTERSAVQVSPGQ